VTSLALAMALAAALGSAPGCPAALDRAGALVDAELAAVAPSLVATLGPQDPQRIGAVLDEAELAVAADPAARAAAGARFRVALSRHCALAAQARLPAAGPEARARAEAILDRPEFRSARTDREAVLRRLLALWQRILDLLETGQAQQYASVSRALFLAAVALAAALGAMALLRRRAARPSRPADAPAAHAPAADARLDAAEAAAARGEATVAVRLALLAALASLEREGSVPPGRYFTNRELLLLLGSATPERQRAARTLSRLFDRAVYGGLPTGPAEAEAAISAARALGTEAPA
jgi:hypothetical protein